VDAGRFGGLASPLEMENHTAEEMANSKVGS
jgi:hypothetical protein